MKRQPYFLRLIGLRPEWFNNFATQLPIANDTLALPAGDVTTFVNEARFNGHASGSWLTGAREFR
jgi:hypothetical protein